MNEVRRRRLILILVLLAAAGVAAALVTLALQQNLTYLHTPTDVHADKVPTDSRFRLGGVVCESSMRRTDGSLEVGFDVTDRQSWFPVRYTGILPDLFREGQSVIATGRLQDGEFYADEVLAKHDETYMPREVADLMAKAKAGAARGGGCRNSPQPSEPAVAGGFEAATKDASTASDDAADDAPASTGYQQD
jgi:cytochrome c-type biogenesis protein CcmE